MKPLVISLLLAISFPTFSQISFFKQLNDVEEGSYPSNFTEFKGEVYFTVRTIDGNRLWKTDGTEAGTVQVTEMNISPYFSLGSPIPLVNSKILFVCNEELYFQIFTSSTLETWKTDGINFMKVDGIYTVPQFCINNNPIIEENINGQLKDVQLNNQLIRFKLNANTQSSFPDLNVVKKVSNNASDDVLIGTTDSLVSLTSNNYLNETRSIDINGDVFFIILKGKTSNQSPYYYHRYELWKTNGSTISYISKLFDIDYRLTDFKIRNLTNFNGKLIFTANYPSNASLWISDGTATGTHQIGNVSNVIFDVNNKSFGILDNKFFFSKTEGNDTELWVSDGTAVGTSLFKNLNANSSSFPSNFEKFGNKVFFRTAQNELWETDGTEIGTKIIHNIPFPENPYLSTIVPQYILTSTNKAFLSNYNNQTGYELYKLEIGNIELVKNINTYSEPSLYSNKKVKLGNKWYFNGLSSKGSELWVSDGTSNETKLLKDLNNGSGSTFINEIVATENYFAFTASQNNITKFFISDGTENGTIQIPILNNARKLTVAGNKVFFLGNGNNLWVSDGTINSTFQVENQIFFGGTPETLVACGNNCIISNGQLYFSDGVPNHTKKLFEIYDQNRPLAPSCLLSFNNKVYFFAKKPLPNNFDNQGIFETDGTAVGTFMIKNFNNDNNFLNSEYLFLEKTSNKMYFRANLDLISTNKSMELWTSDGTEQGTTFVEIIPFKAGNRLSFTSIENKFFLNLYGLLLGSIGETYISDGTEANTYKINEFIGIGGINEIKKFNQKYYFTQFNFDTGTELWETDGTIQGTKLTAEIRSGQPNSQINNLMNFDDKIIMSGTDGNGIALWQYIDNTQIKSIKSGNWDDPTTWNTGVVPAINDNVTIDENHTIVIPAAIQANLFTIIIITGGILEIGNGAGLNLNKAN